MPEYKKILIIFLLFLLFLPHPAVAQVKTEERVIEAYGNSKSQAIINGLVEAVRQVQGLEIEALKESLWNVESNIQETNGDLETNFENSKKIKEEVATYTQGSIENYEIIQVKKVGDKNWRVRLKVYVADYDSERNWGEEKANLAIMPFRVESGLNVGQNINLEQIAKRLNSNIQTRASKSGFFRLLDREYNEEWEKERELLLSQDMSPGERARLGEKLGADFLLTGNITGINSEYSQVDFYGLKVLKYEVSFVVEVRAIEFATREVVWADNVTIKSSGISQKDLKNRYEILNYLIPDLVEGLTEKLNDGLIDALMPMYVLDVSGNKVYINQGKGRLENGEKLQVLGPARRIDDPHRDDTIIIEGESIAEVTVTEVRDDYSIAEIDNLEGNELEKGLTVERVGGVAQKKEKSIFIPQFKRSNKSAQLIQEVFSTPLSQKMHMEFLNSRNIPEDIKIISTGGISDNPGESIYDGIDKPTYVLLGSVDNFDIEVIDKISGLFFEKYALEFKAVISWEILDEEGNKIVMGKEQTKLDFETEASTDKPKDLIKEIDDTKITDEIEAILEEIKMDMQDVVSM